MLAVVAADQRQPCAAVQRDGLDYRETALRALEQPARGAAAAEAGKPGYTQDQAYDGHERGCETQKDLGVEHRVRLAVWFVMRRGRRHAPTAPRP
jgi:hypothetical protein